MAWLTALLKRPWPATVLAIAVIGLSSYGVAHFPRSVVAFLLFQASILLLYLARVKPWLKLLLGGLTLGVLMPVLGTINGY